MSFKELFSSRYNEEKDYQKPNRDQALRVVFCENYIYEYHTVEKLDIESFRANDIAATGFGQRVTYLSNEDIKRLLMPPIVHIAVTLLIGSNANEDEAIRISETEFFYPSKYSMSQVINGLTDIGDIWVKVVADGEVLIDWIEVG